MEGIPYDKQTVQFEAEKVLAEIEKLQKYLNKFKKTFIPNFYRNDDSGEIRPDNSLSITNTNTIYNKPDGAKITQLDKIAKSSKIERNLNFDEYEQKVKYLYKKYFTHLSQFELDKQLAKENLSQSVTVYDRLIKSGYTHQLIEQAIQDARNDTFWSSQMRSFRKLNRKNKDGVQYIDVFLALNRKQHKLSVPKIIR